MLYALFKVYIFMVFLNIFIRCLLYSSVSQLTVDSDNKVSDHHLFFTTNFVLCVQRR